MDGNRDDAQRCLTMAAAALAASDLAKATRLLHKSRRMYPLPAEQDALSASISAASKGRASSRAKNASASSAASSSHHPSPPQQQQQGKSKSKSKSEMAAAADPPRPPTPAMRAAVRAALHPPDRSHYDVLCVPRDADQPAIKRAYRKLALRLHPDRNFAPDAENAFKRVSRAFMTLSDPARRDHYDRFGEDDPADPPQQQQQQQRAAHTHFAQSGCYRRAGARAHHMDFDSFVRANGGAVSADELLDFLFSGMAPRQSAAPRQRRRRRSADSSDDDEEEEEGLDARQRHARARARAEQQQHADGENESAWTRLRPLLWLMLFVLFSLMLSDQPGAAQYALARSAAHPVRHATRHGSTFFTAASSGAARDPRVWRAVDLATLDRLRGQCKREREDEARLRATARAWLVGRDARDNAKRRLAAFRKPGCEAALKLVDALQRYG